jgi:hypothetical protein
MIQWLSHMLFVVVSASAKAWTTLKNALRRALAHEADYRPEAHYMRGPGPKWRAKNAKISARR